MEAAVDPHHDPAVLDEEDPPPAHDIPPAEAAADTGAMGYQRLAPIHSVHEDDPELAEALGRTGLTNIRRDSAGTTWFCSADSGLLELQGKLNQAKATVTVAKDTSKGFFRDLISDSKGVSLHRFQNAIWTLVLGAVYALSVLAELSRPEFNATLLSLMGISSGTYIAFKFPEK